METVNFPVVQSINPWVFSIGVQPPTVDLGAPRDADLEHVILAAIGSYGRQIGRVGEALEVVLARLDWIEARVGDTNRDPAEDAAIDALLDQLAAIRVIRRLRG